MTFEEFEIGTEFRTAASRWRCTDIGVRSIIAVELDTQTLDCEVEDAVEVVFKENEWKDCVPS